MMIAPLAEPASTSVQLKLSQKAISIKSTLKFAQIAALAQMFVRLRQFIRNNPTLINGKWWVFSKHPPFFLDLAVETGFKPVSTVMG